MTGNTNSLANQYPQRHSLTAFNAKLITQFSQMAMRFQVWIFLFYFFSQNVRLFLWRKERQVRWMDTVTQPAKKGNPHYSWWCLLYHEEKPNRHLEPRHLFKRCVCVCLNHISVDLLVLLRFLFGTSLRLIYWQWKGTFLRFCSSSWKYGYIKFGISFVLPRSDIKYG